jgi:quinol monooxygenase YgiN
MTEPFIFIGTHKVRQGKLEEFQSYFAEFCRNTVKPNEPRLLSFHGYTDPAAREVTVVQIHPDSESMVHHMSVVTDHLSTAYAEYLEAESRLQIYGTPRGALLDIMREMSGDATVSTTVQRPFTGFNRLPDL